MVVIVPTHLLWYSAEGLPLSGRGSANGEGLWIGLGTFLLALRTWELTWILLFILLCCHLFQDLGLDPLALNWDAHWWGLTYVPAMLFHILSTGKTWYSLRIACCVFRAHHKVLWSVCDSLIFSCKYPGRNSLFACLIRKFSFKRLSGVGAGR